MHAEFQYDLASHTFFISINSAFAIDFTDAGDARQINSKDVIHPENDNVWCNYDFDIDLRYHIACKTVPIEDLLKHKFDSFEFEFIIE